MAETDSPVDGVWRQVELAAADLEAGRSKSLWVADRQVLICNIAAELCAIEDVCSHDRAPLGEGRIRHGVVECPRHGARFDVRDGSVKAPPAVRPVPVYPVRATPDGGIEVQLIGEPTLRRRASSS